MITRLGRKALNSYSVIAVGRGNHPLFEWEEREVEGRLKKRSLLVLQSILKVVDKIDPRPSSPELHCQSWSWGSAWIQKSWWRTAPTSTWSTSRRCRSTATRNWTTDLYRKRELSSSPSRMFRQQPVHQLVLSTLVQLAACCKMT